jgi:hypothetical protein
MPDKPIVYAPFPDNFDQTTQYIVQLAPVDTGDQIYVGIEVLELPPSTGGGGTIEGM